MEIQRVKLYAPCFKTLLFWLVASYNILYFVVKELLWKKYGKTFLGYEGLYEISNKGAVWCKKKGRCKRIGLGNPSITSYKCVSLEKDGVRTLFPIHRLVATAFLDKKDFKYHKTDDLNNINPDSLIVNHKDENKHNNCVDNLEWCTNAYNLVYSNKRIIRR